MSNAADTKKNAFDGLGDILAAGFDSFLGGDEPEVLLDLDDIEVMAQVRPEDEFEDEENTLADLGKSLRKRQLQSILVRPNIEGSAKPYLLVCGERRVRAARIEGLTQLRGKIAALTDEEAADAQLAENIQRKNLSQRAEAQRVQRDLDELGSKDAVLAKHNKSAAWLSKLLSLLNLPEQTDRLVTENITADVEVIGMAKQIEKVDPQAAKELVDTLKEGKGKVNARQEAKQAKNKVKAPKAPKPPKKPVSNPDAVATPIDQSHKENGPVVSIPTPDAASAQARDPFASDEAPAGESSPAEVFAGAKTEEQAAPADDMPWDALAETTQEQQEEQDEQEGGAALPFAPTVALDAAYNLIFEDGRDVASVLAGMTEEERDQCEGWLTGYYEAGIQTKEVGGAVIKGFRNGQFATEGSAAFALAAFLYGLDSEGKFNMLNILGSVKA